MIGRRRYATWEGVSDEDVLASYARGEDPESAFAELVTRYERRVYGICLRYFGNAADAEDATQDAFLSIARRADTFQGGSRLSTWIYRVAVNACNDLARKRARRPQTPVADVVRAVDAVEARDDIGWDPGDPVLTAETASEVQRALLTLDDTSRSLLILVALQGLSYNEAAAALDVPVGTAKSRVHRARAQLADLLGASGAAGNQRGPDDLLPTDTPQGDSTRER
ncbi:MAG: RNA polymerase sigma factor [Nitriliruptorales bacterium]